MDLYSLIDSYRAQFTQQNRLIQLKIDRKNWDEQLLALAVEGSETLSDSGNRYQVQALALDNQLDLTTLIGLSACLSVRNGLCCINRMQVAKPLSPGGFMACAPLQASRVA